MDGTCLSRSEYLLRTTFRIIDYPPQPSTWEVMIRAELGTGNRDRALDLVERLKSR